MNQRQIGIDWVTAWTESHKGEKCTKFNWTYHPKLLRLLINDYGFNEYKRRRELYFSEPNVFYIQALHPVGLFYRDFARFAMTTTTRILEVQRADKEREKVEKPPETRTSKGETKESFSILQSLFPTMFETCKECNQKIHIERYASHLAQHKEVYEINRNI